MFYFCIMPFSVSSVDPWNTYSSRITFYPDNLKFCATLKSHLFLSLPVNFASTNRGNSSRKNRVGYNNNIITNILSTSTQCLHVHACNLCSKHVLECWNCSPSLKWPSVPWPGGIPPDVFIRTRQPQDISEVGRSHQRIVASAFLLLNPAPCLLILFTLWFLHNSAQGQWQVDMLIAGPLACLHYSSLLRRKMPGQENLFFYLLHFPVRKDKPSHLTTSNLWGSVTLTAPLAWTKCEQWPQGEDFHWPFLNA